ncbi:MAG: tRNA (adenosine(37)-N6)-threonylcarbamoyltransferase complex ATPase subunit type 1 TsaE [Phycisphaeraceae bacterium]|nr:tRNA (adenosine(37)-N6)-threonylcarbamoyltransferase complex ATPase subunit type 1 TsaE [Phycisphaeraceae bacterium]
MRLTARSCHERQTIALGRALGAALFPGDVVALEGELGAGKTRFVRGVCEGLGLDPAQVSSPTFVLMNEYASPMDHQRTPRAVLRHVDAYRLRGTDDLDSMGWDCVSDGAAVVVVEWASRIAPALQEAVHRAAHHTMEPVLFTVRIETEGAADEVDGRGTRTLTLDAPDAAQRRAGWARIAEAWAAAGISARGGSLPEGWARCPTTGKPVSPDSPTFPFIDERARMADLGRWMSGHYRVSREITPEDADKLPPPESN